MRRNGTVKFFNQAKGMALLLPMGAARIFLSILQPYRSPEFRS